MCIRDRAATLLMLQGVIKLIADIMVVIGIEVDEEAFGPVTDGDAIGKETA